jgi:hypothetical protein
MSVFAHELAKIWKRNLIPVKAVGAGRWSPKRFTTTGVESRQIKYAPLRTSNKMNFYDFEG